MKSKKGLWIVLCAVVLLLSVVFSRHALVTYVLERTIEKETGMKVRMKGVTVTLFLKELTIDEMIYWNPSDFGSEQAMVICDFHGNWDLFAFFSKKFDLNLVELRLSEVHILKKAQGEINLAPVVQWIKRKLDAKEIQIHQLILSQEKFSFRDLSESEDQVLQFTSNGESMTFENIMTSNDLDDVSKHLAQQLGKNNPTGMFKALFRGKIDDLLELTH
jgi:hypothetical protein